MDRNDPFHMHGELRETVEWIEDTYFDKKVRSHLIDRKKKGGNMRLCATNIEDLRDKIILPQGVLKKDAFYYIFENGIDDICEWIVFYPQKQQ